MPNMEYTYSLFLKSQVSLSSSEKNVLNMEYEITFPKNQVSLSSGEENVPNIEYILIFLKNPK